MTNKEKYKQTFDTLSASVNFSLEVDKMSILNRKHKLTTLAAAVAACLIVTVGTGTAYASDLGTQPYTRRNYGRTKCSGYRI